MEAVYPYEHKLKQYIKNIQPSCFNSEVEKEETV